jgi:hypothetical protein
MESLPKANEFVHMDFRQEIKLFVAKVLILGALFSSILGVGIVAEILVLRFFISTTSTAVSASAPNLLFAVAANFLADPAGWLARHSAELETISPEERQALHESVRRLVTQLQPYLDDVQPLMKSIDACKVNPNANR